MSPRRGSRSYKKGQTYRQFTDGWNRLRGRIKKHITKALARFPPERFQQAWDLSEQKAREKLQLLQQQQQHSAEPAFTKARDGVSTRPDAAACPEDDFEDADPEQRQWNQPMAMLVMHGPHGKQSLYRSNELSFSSSSIAHQAALFACSALETVADHQRLTARMEAMDLPQPRMGQLINAGLPCRRRKWHLPRTSGTKPARSSQLWSNLSSMLPAKLASEYLIGTNGRAFISDRTCMNVLLGMAATASGSS